MYKEPRTFGELREFVKRLRHSLGDEDDEEIVAVLDRDNFEDRTGEVTFTFILFHADWCRYCRSAFKFYLNTSFEKLPGLYPILGRRLPSSIKVRVNHL